MYSPLFSCPLLSSKLDSPVIKTEESLFFSFSECLSKLDSPVIKILERHSLKLKNMLSSVLITGESNLDEISGQLNRGAYMLKLLVTKISTLLNS